MHPGVVGCLPVQVLSWSAGRTLRHRYPSNSCVHTLTSTSILGRLGRYIYSPLDSLVSPTIHTTQYSNNVYQQSTHHVFHQRQLPSPCYPSILCVLHNPSRVCRQPPRLAWLQNQQREPKSLPGAVGGPRQSPRRSVRSLFRTKTTACNRALFLY